MELGPMSLHCPHCREVLVRCSEGQIIVWRCRRCDGVAVTLAALRRVVDHEKIRKAWLRTIGENRRALVRCPACPVSMHRVPIGSPEVDVCRQCQMVWLDAGEIEELPPRSQRSLREEEYRREAKQYVRTRWLHDEFMRRRWRRHGAIFAW